MTAIDTHDWKGLAQRSASGLEVALLWSRSADRVKVAVTDEDHEQRFELDVPNDEALVGFYHPFAYMPAVGATAAALTTGGLR